ncbi:hypothetical protein ROT00_01925 [Agromyces mediolanus]|uniref:hypothetical protein n=1 Tax=Agromyces mediolanus TaxID=41986 RepID=UPI0038396AB0
MSMTISIREPFPDRVPGLSFAAAAPDLWRVAASDGALLGHIRRREIGGVERFSSRRLLPGGRHGIDLGEFWSPRDAAEVFR